MAGNLQKELAPSGLEPQALDPAGLLPASRRAPATREQIDSAAVAAPHSPSLAFAPAPLADNPQVVGLPLYSIVSIAASLEAASMPASPTMVAAESEAEALVALVGAAVVLVEPCKAVQKALP